jgi:hypothetical protein
MKMKETFTGRDERLIGPLAGRFEHFEPAADNPRGFGFDSDRFIFTVDRPLTATFKLTDISAPVGGGVNFVIILRKVGQLGLIDRGENFTPHSYTLLPINTNKGYVDAFRGVNYGKKPVIQFAAEMSPGDYELRLDVAYQSIIPQAAFQSPYRLTIDPGSSPSSSRPVDAVPPAALSDSFLINAAEVGKKGVALDILDNDTPRTGNLNLKSAQIVDAPDNGTASIKKGTLLYKPDPGFEGTDTLTYTVADGSGQSSNPAQVRIEVRQPDPPRAADDRFTLNAAEIGKKGVALDILVNDTASTGALNLKSAQIVDAPDHGTASIRKGTLLYKPDPGFEGTDTLAYTVADASGRASNPAQVRIEVRQPDPPRAADDRFTLDASAIGKKGVPLDILDNDTPSTGNLNLKSVQIVDAPDHGTASVKKGVLLYKPDAGFTGTDTLAYTVADASGRPSNTAQVRIDVRQPDGSNNDQPPPPPPLPPGPSGPLAAGEPAGPLLTLAGSPSSAPLTLADLLDADDAIGTAGTANAAPDPHTAATPPPGPTLDSLITTTDDPAALA